MIRLPSIPACCAAVCAASFAAGLVSCSSAGGHQPGQTHYYVPEIRRAEAPTPEAWDATFPKVKRRECLAIAEQYLNHLWRPSKKNILHAPDPKGILVNTPDEGYRPEKGVPGWWIPDKLNRGIPYQWGGFSTIEQFDEGIAKGLAAGDVYTTAKRHRLDDAVSQHAVGIDCSGFVSRCWKLPHTFSTRDLPRLCSPLASFDDLLPGDILNTHNNHVLIFAGWSGSSRHTLIVYETGCPPDWKVVKHGLLRKPLEEFGFKPYRYRNIL